MMYAHYSLFWGASKPNPNPTKARGARAGVGNVHPYSLAYTWESFAYSMKTDKKKSTIELHKTQLFF